ncbi:TIGR03086 family metal-binding protein [Actinomadura parmotrematis]|uniref:TIGR03086 family protein n=1 Tax=Actinomadura parmotrematis TaxID=2864039 RepID=A0ABS7G177_9ACTN|nr:TIGR03086 family metal-binding protein [Actinomadura parmotrematis]MBW8486471.1 TIGR03086 family protein [Actinomadura parmotrematis]
MAEDPGTALVDQAVGYALLAMAGLRADALARATPCRGWDLGTLCAHLAESLVILRETVTGTPAVRACRPGRDPVAACRTEALRLARAWPAGGDGARPLAAVAATEVAVHGWDIARSLGACRPMPDGLAERLLRAAPALVGGGRAGLFAPPVAWPPDAPPGERLLALLGRRPG